MPPKSLTRVKPRGPGIKNAARRGISIIHLPGIYPALAISCIIRKRSSGTQIFWDSIRSG